jgi:hypothetical protein
MLRDASLYGDEYMIRADARRWLTQSCGGNGNSHRSRAHPVPALHDVPGYYSNQRVAHALAFPPDDASDLPRSTYRSEK